MVVSCLNIMEMLAANRNHSLSGIGLCLIILQTAVSRRVGKASDGGVTFAKCLVIGSWEQT